MKDEKYSEQKPQDIFEGLIYEYIKLIYQKNSQRKILDFDLADIISNVWANEETSVVTFPPPDICKAAYQIPENDYYPQEVIDQYVYNLTVIQGQYLGLQNEDLQLYCVEQYDQNKNIVEENIKKTESKIGQKIDYSSKVTVAHDETSTKIYGIQGVVYLGPDIGYVIYDQTGKFYLYGQ